MNIQVHGDHLGVTPALHDFVDKKIGRLEKYFDAPPEREIYVTMSVERNVHRVEVMLHMHGVMFRAEESTDDMYSSIDRVVDKLEQQINKYKTKLNQRFRDKGHRTTIKHPGKQQTSFASYDDEDTGRVVRTKRFPMKPMNIEEAMMQMELLGHDFYVFTNADSEEVNVVYKRKNGNFGLIEPS